jgi:serralysin
LDFTGVAGAFTFIPGDIAESVTVNINADFIYEADETFDFTLSSPGNATLGTPSSTTITIQNDALNDPVPNAAFSLAPYSANEPATGSTNATVTVSLNRQSGETVVINYSTTNGTATGSAGCGGSTGRDYITTSGSLTYNPGELTKTFDIPVCADSIVETGGESLTITISRNIAFGQVTISSPTTQLWIYDP